MREQRGTSFNLKLNSFLVSRPSALFAFYVFIIHICAFCVFILILSPSTWLLHPSPPPTLSTGPEATAFVPHVRGRDRRREGVAEEVPESLLQPLPAAILTALRRVSFRPSIRLSIRLSFRLSVCRICLSPRLSVRPVNRSHL